MYTAHQEYLASEVLTAAPQKLQLLLIDAAVRQAEKAKDRLVARQWEAAGEAIIKCQEIVTEILSGLNFDAGAPLVRKIAGVYNFVFRSLVAAHLKRDAKSIDDALSVLRTERQTWQAVCDQLGHQAPPAVGTATESAGGLSLQA